MNAIEVIKQKAKSAYHFGGLRNRKTSEMKRARTRSEADAIGRPRKSPKSSEVPVAEGNAQPGSISDAPRPVEVETEAVRERPIADTAPDHSPARHSGSHVDIDVAKEGSLKDHDRKAGSDQSIGRFTLGGQQQHQAIREKAYVWFRGEAADDYTYGPVRILKCSDGVDSQCASLLLTLEFSAKVQATVRAEREFLKLERRATKEMGVAERFESRLKREIRNHKGRLSDFEPDQTEPEKEAALRKELEVLEQMLEQSKTDQQCSQTLVNSRASILREVQAETIAYLEEAFVYANLLKPEEDDDDESIEERDLDEEYAKFRQRNQEENDGRPITPLDVSRDHMLAPPPTAEQQARQELIDAWWTARDRFRVAQDAFDARESDRDRDKQDYMEAVELGYKSIDDVADDFDLPWLQRFQRMTRELIDAEKTFTVARANVDEAGIDIESKHAFTSPTNSELGGPDQQNQVQNVSTFAASNQRIARWRESVPRSMSPRENEDEDSGAGEVSEDLDIVPFDSVSAAAEGTVRRLIIHWSKICKDDSCENKVCKSVIFNNRTVDQCAFETPASEEEGGSGKIAEKKSADEVSQEKASDEPSGDRTPDGSVEKEASHATSSKKACSDISVEEAADKTSEEEAPEVTSVEKEAVDSSEEKVAVKPPEEAAADEAPEANTVDESIGREAANEPAEEKASNETSGEGASSHVSEEKASSDSSRRRHPMKLRKRKHKKRYQR